MARLSFIATRKAGVERYRFVGLPNRTFTLEPTQDGRWICDLLSWPTRQQALEDLFESAQFALERQQRRY